MSGRPFHRPSRPRFARDDAPALPEDPSIRRVLGMQAVREAIIVHGAALKVVRVESRTQDGEQLAALARFAEGRGAKVERVDRGTLDRIAQGERHQGVIADAPPLAVLDLDEAMPALEAIESPLIVALDELTDPQNFGAIVRTAVAMGADAVLWPEDKSAPLSTSMVRASAGAVEHARLIRVASLPRALETLRDEAYDVIGLEMSGASPIESSPLDRKLVLVVGSEGKGLRRQTKAACTALAKLPMPGPIGSLNASVAAAMAIYEAVRQRRARDGATE